MVVFGPPQLRKYRCSYRRENPGSKYDKAVELNISIWNEETLLEKYTDFKL